ncbi:hypothetical protein [Streptococcus uberis]|nr:hypothetical protein [Streptococcus uberis]
MTTMQNITTDIFNYGNEQISTKNHLLIISSPKQSNFQTVD